MGEMCRKYKQLLSQTLQLPAALVSRWCLVSRESGVSPSLICLMDAEDLQGSRKGNEPESPNHALEAEW